jgi:hypothetical protein
MLRISHSPSAYPRSIHHNDSSIVALGEHPRSSSQGLGSTLANIVIELRRHTEWLAELNEICDVVKAQSVVEDSAPN